MLKTVPKRDADASAHPLRAWRMRQIVKAAVWGRPEQVMTLQQAASLGGWTPSLWSQWERRKRLPDQANMAKLCKITGLEPNDFYLVDGVPFTEWRRRRRAG